MFHQREFFATRESLSAEASSSGRDVAGEVQAEAARRRKATQAMKAQWFRERDAALQHEMVANELARESRFDGRGASVRDEPGTPMPRDHSEPAASHAAAGPGIDSEAYLTRLTERLADRLREELRAEVEKEQRASMLARQLIEAREGAVLEGHLVKELESHTCPICYELMVPPQHGPVLLFPCGHSFCSECLDHHMVTHGKGLCPFCRMPIKSRAANIALQQLIQGYAARKDKLRSRGDDPALASWDGPPSGVPVPVAGPGRGGGSENDDTDDYKRQLDMLLVRCRVLWNEAEDCAQEATALDLQATRAESVAEELRGEERDAAQRVEEAKAYLCQVQQRIASQQQEAERLGVLAAKTRERETLVRTTLEGLEKEAEKLRVLSMASRSRS